MPSYVVPKKSGFTLLELLVSIGVFTILVTIVMPITIDFLRTYSLISERDTLVTLMEWARDQSMANSNEISHGVKATSNQYVGFKGTSYISRNSLYDLAYPRSGALTITGPTEVVFEPLTGKTSAIQLTLSNGTKQYQISVNAEGSIDW